MSEISEIEIPDIIQDYLEPIPGGSSAGIDASNEEEYFVLNMEIPKTNPDYKKCIELSTIILKEKSKDIKVATWICFAMFRTEKIKGLVNGFKLIYHLLRKYENSLYPENPNYRSKAIQFLNQPRFFKLVEREVPNSSNAKDFIEAGIILNLILEESKRLFSENAPVLKAIAEVIQSHVETAKEILSPPKEKLNKPPVQMQPEKKVEVLEKPVNESITPPKIEDKPVRPTVSVKEDNQQQPVKIHSESDNVIQLRQILIHFFEYQVDGAKKEKVPESHFIFGISRQLQWGKLLPPMEKESITQIEAPNSIMQSNIKKWFETFDWDTLIPKIEINFLKADSAFPYWIDAQRFITKALEQKGGNYAIASEEIKRQLSQLIDRIPDIHTLKFKDKITPFADDQTVKWIYDEVMSAPNREDSKNQIILPPIMGEDYESIGHDYQLACSELPKNIEINIAAMQKAIDSDNRLKGKFLRRLNLANYCMQAKQHELAKVHLTELRIFIDEYNLAIWESALCTAVWQSIYLVNKELLSGRRDKELKMILEKEQIDLFTKIAKYDSIVAIKLKQKK